nr:hypothetical protein [Tanacetum cinerariifolium]
MEKRKKSKSTKSKSTKVKVKDGAKIKEMLNGPTRDIGVFIGYSKESAAFRIYNKQTRKIYESVNVNFEEILEMASKQFSLEPGLSNLKETRKSSNLSVSQVSETSKKDLEDLFQKFYGEYFDSSKIMKSSTMNVETSNVEIPSHEDEVFHESSESFQKESSSSLLNDDIQQSLEEVAVPSSNTQSFSNNMVPNVDEASTTHNVFNERLEDAYFDASQLANSCLFSCLLSSIEPANVAEALRDADWRFSTEFLKGSVCCSTSRFCQQAIPDHVYALDKALYGLKQAPRVWYDVIWQFLIDSGFQKGSIDTTLFIKKKGKHIMLIQIYVDDIIFGSTNPKYCIKFSDIMVKHFEMSMMEEMKFFLGLQVNQFSNGIFINQSKYILDLLKRYGMENCDTVLTPMVEQAKLKLDLVRKPVDHSDYRSMIGSLMYVTSSRSDIMFSTCICARYQENPNEHHVSAVKRIFRYLKGTINFGLWYLKDYGFDLTAYLDADHAGCHLDRKRIILAYVDGVTRCDLVTLKILLWSSRTEIDLPRSLASHLGKLGLEFGDSYKAPPEETCKGPASESSAKKKGRTIVITTEDMQKRRNDLKARTTLLLALPDEHQLRFSKYETTKELWEAILKTFGGNEATKKTKKNQLKQQCGNFKPGGLETLEQTFNRLQAIRNKDDLDTMSLDDVYNHLKVYKLEVQKKSESNSQNMAFISSSNTNSGKGKVHTASVPTASTQVSTASTDIAAASLSHDTVYAYIDTQSNGSQIKYEDITQIDEYDIEEIDIK